MIRDELHSLERLVDELVRDPSDQQTAVSSNRRGELLRSVIRACEDLRRKWSGRLFGNVREQVIHRYLRYHQSGLVRISDMLHDDLLRTADSQELAVLTLQVQECIDALLQFMQHAFPDHFVMDMAISRHRRLREYQELRRHTDKLAGDFQRKLMGSALAGVIILSLKQAVAEFPIEPVTNRRSTVIYRLIISLRHFMAERDTVDEKELFLIALQMDLNSKLVMDWFNKQIHHPGFFSVRELTEIVDAQQPADQPRIDPHAPSLREILISNLHESSENQASTEATLQQHPQMPLTLSVAQLALFTRICYRNGCFSTHNAAEIIRFFTTHFTTKRQENISVKSFTKGFYAMDQTSAAVIRDFLQRMIAFINKTYFP